MPLNKETKPNQTKPDQNKHCLSLWCYRIFRQNIWLQYIWQINTLLYLNLSRWITNQSKELIYGFISAYFNDISIRPFQVILVV